MKKYVHIIFYALTCLSLKSTKSFSQDYNFSFSKLTIENGLSSNRITTIYQDSKGFIWIGTEDGLNRYDGYDFKVYRKNRSHKNSLSHNYVWSICEDDSGNIWIGTNSGGLNKFDPVYENFLHFRHIPNDNTSLANDLVPYVYVDQFNNIWAGTWGGGLNLLDKNNNAFVRYQNRDGDNVSISNDKIWSIYEDAHKNLWVGTAGGGLNLFNRDDGTFKQFFPGDLPNSFPGASAVTLRQLSDNKLWIGMHGEGLTQYDYDTATFNHIKSGNKKGQLKGNHIWRILEDNQNMVWIATQSGGLNIFDFKRQEFTPILLDPENPKNQSTNRVKALFEDNNNVLWIGTLADGIYKLDRKPRKFSTIQKNKNNLNSLPEDFVYTICQDRPGDIWIGNYSNVTRYTPSTGKFKIYPTRESGDKFVAGQRVRYIFEDSAGEIWIGTYFGKLNRYDRKTDTFVKYDLNFNNTNSNLNNVRVIFEDSDGILWFGINGEGLIKYDRKNNSYQLFDTKTESQSRISGDAVLSIVEDEQKNLWIGTFGKGLNKFNKETGTFEHFYSSEDDTSSLSDNSVTELFFDSQNVLWVGTFSGGLCRYNKQQNSFTTYREEDGLSGNFICGILQDAEKNLWISTSKGISRFTPETENFKNYDFAQGVQKGEFMPGARIKATNNRLYFGGVNGITHFHPDSITASSRTPEVVITSFKVRNRNAELPRSITFLDTIYLGSNENNFSFEFTSLDYTNPGRNEYAYTLIGIDEGWNYSGNRRFANYTHVAPGEYLFKVKATNNEGVWNETGASLTIIVQPPFWATWWFRVLATVGAVGLIFSFYKNRILRLQKEKHAQEEFSKKLIQYQEEERRRIASELHDSLGQDLLIIKNSAAMGLKSKNVKQKTEQLEEISNNTSIAIDDVRRIAHNLHPHQLDMLGLTKALKSIFARIENVSEIHFSIFIENIDGIFNKDQEINIYRIVQECVNNIIKHSGATTAEVRLNLTEGYLLASISDNGKGFIINKKAVQDLGFGMKNILERIKILSGEIDIKSMPNEGSTISVKIPVQN